VKPGCGGGCSAKLVGAVTRDGPGVITCLEGGGFGGGWVKKAAGYKAQTGSKEQSCYRRTDVEENVRERGGKRRRRTFSTLRRRIKNLVDKRPLEGRRVRHVRGGKDTWDREGGGGEEGNESSRGGE